MIVIVGASGKLGLTIVSALRKHTLVPQNEITCTSSSSEGTARLKQATNSAVSIKQANWDDTQEHWVKVLQGCDKLLLISSSRIELDFNDAPPGEGREADHYRVLGAARAAGVRHVYYTSLTFANPTLGNVMKAHERTEDWLHQHAAPMGFTIIREGPYMEGWPLYFGFYDIDGYKREDVMVAGDGKLCWTSISDLGVGTALVLADPPDKWTGKTINLSRTKLHSLTDIAAMVSTAKGMQVKLQILDKLMCEQYYITKKGIPKPMVEWWSTSFAALEAGECDIRDPLLETLLGDLGVKPKDLEATVVATLS